MLDLEETAIAHVAAVDPDLPVARPLAPRAAFDGHQVRLFERRDGHKGGPELDDDAVRGIAAVHARLCLALRSFFHPAAGRELLWDLRAAPQLRPLLDEIAAPGRRALVARVLDRYEERVPPAWDRLRGQVVHGDFNLDNLLLDDGNRVSGILDFGDCCHTALAADVAVGLASLLRGRPAEDVFRTARIALDGFASHLPLEPLELELLGELVAARLAAIVSISAWRSRRFPENAAYIEAWDDDSWHLLELLDGLEPGEVARELGARPTSGAGSNLVRRRNEAFGALLTPLTYTRPVHAARAEGVWIYEPDGHRLLDAYNNVPVVGHCHPRVTEAVVRQTRLGATNAQVPRRAADRARRTAARHLPAGGGARHGAARQLRQRGERPRLAARDGSDRPQRRARDRERVPRRDRGDDGAVAGGLAVGPFPGPGHPHSAAGSRRRPGRRAPRPRRKSRRDVPRRVAHERRHPRARDRRASAARGADARRGRALRRRRGAGRPRPARARSSGRSYRTASRRTS